MCQAPGCTTRPSFGPPETKEKRYCAKHRRDTDVDVVHKRCMAPGCMTQPVYGPPGTKEKLYCVAHKLADDVNITAKRCQEPGCITQPTYGPPGGKKKLYCNTHKRAGDVDVANKRCLAPNCATQPVFGPSGSKKGLYCAVHKRVDDVDVVNKRCLEPGCTTQPSCGPPGTNKKLYCSAHKRANDVNIVSKRCLAPGCMTMPSCGPPGTKTGLYCSAHKRADDIDVVSKQCREPGCTTKPSCGPPGTKERLYCKVHKRADDVNVVSKRCQALGCTIIPTYGPPETKEGLYCNIHKRVDDVDVKHKQCLAPGCATRPNYGIPGSMPERCYTHIEPGMIMNPRKRCDQCTELGIWGRSRVAADRRCDAHRCFDDKNLIEGRCVSCGLECVLDKQGTCLLCGEAGKIKRQFLDKQRRVKTVIEREFKVESYDKIIDSGVCSRKRPDFVIDGTYRKVVVEIDEYQHKRGNEYGPDCEYRRMWDITQALGMPTVFVRYNPDPYAGADGKRCDPAQSVREAALVSWIKTLLDREPPAGGFASALYLYYDGFDVSEKAIEEVLTDPMGMFSPPQKAMPALTDDDLAELFAYLGV